MHANLKNARTWRSTAIAMTAHVSQILATLRGLISAWINVRECRFEKFLFSILRNIFLLRKEKRFCFRSKALAFFPKPLAPTIPHSFLLKKSL